VLTYGTVTWFDPGGGIGAISVDGGERVVGVGSVEIDGGGRQSLRGGDRVAFTLLDGPGGTRAVRVWVP
jgi:cold shock CspA family protein